MDALFGGRQNITPSYLEEPDIDEQGADDDNFFIVDYGTQSQELHHDENSTDEDEDGAQHEEQSQREMNIQEMFEEFLAEAAPSASFISSCTPLSAPLPDVTSAISHKLWLKKFVDFVACQNRRRPLGLGYPTN